MVCTLGIRRVFNGDRLTDLRLVEELGLEFFLDRHSRHEEQNEQSKSKPDIDTHC